MNERRFGSYYREVYASIMWERLLLSMNQLLLGTNLKSSSKKISLFIMIIDYLFWIMVEELKMP
ncbi:MAG TPA: hypothetical protein DIU37_05155 [Opitutae bacterium]|nr:hypothetical protein [Opitutae bacterium]|tara:strand:- start:210 stop:401 length:192 start_codon:yes stop_codon:yes gene_type:complete